ncbi:Cell division protease ftsH [Nitrospirillum viridazoti Y2]|uniref:ATPase family protein associated with various cellular activities (AAA) n=1 Tax=Nitrospirillum amazonense TaxID=28077 RepID=A0A560IER3_9PROT|nr:ATP-binding protein [Nitrospirillum amazonense]EGY00459.1 Cell division protease ftsH [Nitrospirillum amazonense Y2]TWB56621.1 ATPase family protein associated with various cellular activities (AAA) [Nitrospirillum amazonense]
MVHLDDLTAADIDALLDLPPAQHPLPVDVRFARTLVLDAILRTPMDTTLGGTMNASQQVIPKVQTAASVLVPNAEWLAPVEAALRHLLNNRLDEDPGDPWLVVTAHEGTSCVEQGIAVRDAWQQGRSVVGVGVATQHLPLMFWNPPAHCQGRLPALSSVQVAEFLADEADRWPDFAHELLPNTVAAEVSPTDLALGWHEGIGSDEWLAAILSLVAARLSRQRQVQVAAEEPAVPERQRSPEAPRLNDLAGMDEAVAWGQTLARDLDDYRASLIGWESVDRGVLLAGPPGTGKTTFAAALARTCGVPLITGSHSSWQAAGHQGEMLKAMAVSFEEAAAHRPCILFIDELDSFTSRTASANGHNSTYQRQVVNSLLQHLDGMASRKGVVVVGATNLPEAVEPALLRPGRLERVVPIPLPDIAALIRILRFHLGTDLKDTDLYQAAAIAAQAGATGAHIMMWVRAARRRARTARRPMRLGDLVGPLLALDETERGAAVAVAVPVGTMQ